ncbi:MAG: hypothetical protein DI597_04970 [Pseudoxanthomonas spadix]|nr:MAG: hypothetical protein DI597_04970 [Pseudoxanthomonas spadix]
MGTCIHSVVRRETVAVNRTKKAMQRTALSVALGMCFSTVAFAQSNTQGAIFGQATAGSTVQIVNPSTGFSRSTTVGADGTYRFSALSPGSYNVTLQGDGGAAIASREGVYVSIGGGTPVNFTTSGGSAATLDTVTVRGTAIASQIDVSSVESTSVFTAEQLAKIPVSRDTTSVALLAPGTVRGDNAFGNLASFGGSSVAENQYYVNGFNVTNTFRNLNFSKIPFEAIAQQQVKTGGYGAEFGRSTGGVINIITKQGTNDFHAGANVFWSPDSLRAKTKNVYYANPLTPNSFGKLEEDNSKDEEDEWVGAVWASGALVKDHLFVYGLLQYSQKDSQAWGNVDSFNNTKDSVDNPNWVLKMDWNINDSNKIEFTAFKDTQKTKSRTYLNEPGELDRGALIGTSHSENGGENYIGKYTGYLTDNFTLTALYGHGTFDRSTYLRTAAGDLVEYGGDLNVPATGCPIIVDARSDLRKAATGVYGSTCNITGGSIDRKDSKDTRDQYRVDAEWALGDHLIRFGYDRDDYESVAGQAYEGGRIWRYSTNVGPDGQLNTADDFDIVREQIVQQGSTVKLKQWAFYVEDSWNVTENFLAYIGARWDTFENLNGDGATYVKIDKQFGPRLGFSWDVNGDSSLKFYGNAGRYALPLTPSVAVRGASASLFTRQNFNFTQVDPVTGAPVNPTPRSALSYVNAETGEPKNPETIAAKNLDPMYQDEYILGFEQQLTEHQSIGAKGTYRKLKAAIDDNCDYTPIYNRAIEDGLDPVLPSAGFPYCRMFNPGKDPVYLTDIEDNGTLTEYKIDGSLLSPDAKRTYKALDLFWNGYWDRLFIQASWTIAWNKGNTEGGVKSDIGQADTSVTQDFDYKELMVDAYGYLPNDRRHSVKIFGNYQFTDEWSVGANLIVQSGRPKNCLGDLDLNPAPGSDNFSPHPYGSSFFRCGTTEIGASGPVSAVPRGKAGRLPWTNSIDLNVAYAPLWAPGLQFKIDVFNVFNNQKVTAVSEVAENGYQTDGTPLNTYGLARAYQAPRSARFMVQYDF